MLFIHTFVPYHARHEPYDHYFEQNENFYEQTHFYCRFHHH